MATVIDVVVLKFSLVRREIDEIVRYLPNKKNKISAASQTVATARIVSKICQGQSPTMLQISSKSFTVGGVITEVN